MNAGGGNVDRREVGRFARMAARWWDPEGDMAPLHVINPVRAEYIESRAGGLAGRRALDVGCGGGLLTEALAERGAEATGIDASEPSIRVARLHAEEAGVEVTYEQATAEDWADRHPEAYDVVCCLELLEHVPDPAAVVAACARLARPGADVFFSTLNRTPQAFLLGIVAAEYVLGLLPRGTHTYERFIRPAELAAWQRAAGLEQLQARGIYYNPVTRGARLGERLDVNYIVHARKPEAA